MSRRIYPISYNDQEIIYTDWRDIVDAAEFISSIWETTNWVVERGEKDLLEIVDVRGAFFSLDIFQHLKKAASQARPFNKRKAVVGDFSDGRLLMLKFLNSFSQDKITPFRSLDDAKEWVIKD